MAEEKIINVRRTLVYTGAPDWLAGTLQRSIQIGRPLRTGHGEIRCESVATSDLTSDAMLGALATVRPALVYIAGPFGAPSPEQHRENVQLAAAYRTPIARLGCYPVCPHKNTETLGGPTGFDPDGTQQNKWYEGSIELLRRCDALLLIPGWRQSHGAQREYSAAQSWGIPTFISRAGVQDLGGLEDWVRTGQVPS